VSAQLPQTNTPTVHLSTVHKVDTECDKLRRWLSAELRWQHLRRSTGRGEIF